MKLESLENYVMHQVKDLLSGEKQLVKALPRIAGNPATRSPRWSMPARSERDITRGTGHDRPDPAAN
jgi:hypothetical protein